MVSVSPLEMPTEFCTSAATKETMLEEEEEVSYMEEEVSVCDSCR